MHCRAFTQIMAMSRKLQYGKLESREGDSKLEPYETVEVLPKTGVKVAYQGVPGAYSHEAMINYFGEMSTVLTLIPSGTRWRK